MHKAEYGPLGKLWLYFLIACSIGVLGFLLLRTMNVL